MEAGLTSLATQTSISLINNQGDLGAVLSELGSADSLRGLVTAMVSAGLTSGITTGLGNAGVLSQVGGAPTDALIDRVTYQVQRQAIVASVNTALDVVVLGEGLDDALVSNLRTSAASVVGTVAAQSIGVAAFNRDIDRATQLIAHAALGCATGAIGSGDCSSGAIGAFAGELTALVYSDAALNDPTLIGDSIERWKDNGVSLAQLAGGLAAAMAGGSANVGGNAGANAAENNALWLIPVIIAAAYTTHAGDGDPVEGLIVIGRQEDVLQQMLAAAGEQVVALSYDTFPEETAAVLGAAIALGEGTGVVVSYFDDLTGNTVSGAWNTLPPDVQDGIQGGTIVLGSVFMSGAIASRIAPRLARATPDTGPTRPETGGGLQIGH